MYIGYIYGEEVRLLAVKVILQKKKVWYSISQLVFICWLAHYEYYIIHVELFLETLLLLPVLANS